MLVLRRARMAASPAFLRGAFRPFFFGGAAWAVLALTLWLLTLAGAIPLPSVLEPLAWHRHEMLFGFVGAIIAGFLLTAIPNWTGRLPIAGAPLAALFGLWLAARAAVLFSSIVGPFVAAAIDVGFYIVLAAVAGREVIAAKNRNLPIVGLVLLFAAACGADHAFPEAATGSRAAIALVVLMISVIGGRIVPSFTNNRMQKHGLGGRRPTQPAAFDLAVIGVTAAALLAWIVLRETDALGVLLLVAGLLQAMRLARWRGLTTARDPLVFILHVGYAWVPLGLSLLGASLIGAPIPTSAAIHALTAGAMGTMILAVMTRASLGHTGRVLEASMPTVVLYALVTAGALLRVAAPIGLIDYTMGMELAAISWGGAFILFLTQYGPILVRPRLGEG